VGWGLGYGLEAEGGWGWGVRVVSGSNLSIIRPSGRGSYTMRWGCARPRPSRGPGGLVHMDFFFVLRLTQEKTGGSTVGDREGTLAPLAPLVLVCAGGGSYTIHWGWGVGDHDHRGVHPSCGHAEFFRTKIDPQKDQ